MMKKTLLFLLLTSGYGLFAQTNASINNDPQARAILKKVTAKYKSYKTISSKVLFTVENGQGAKTATQSGTIQIKGNKYYLQMSDNTSFSDGSTIYNYDKASKEMQLTRFNPKDQMLTPQKLFTDFYDKDFLYILSGEVKRSGRTINQIELTPLDKTQVYFKVILDIDKATNSILSAKIFEKNGNKYIYELTSQDANVPIPDSKFVFSQSAYPGVEVIDLR